MPALEQAPVEQRNYARSSKWLVCVVLLFTLVNAGLNPRLIAEETTDTLVAEESSPQVTESTETDIAETATEASEEAGETATSSDESGSDEADTQPAENSKSSDTKQDDAKEESEPPADSKKSSSQDKESKSKSGNSEGKASETEEAPAESENSVEEERTMEVEPPAVEPKQPVEVKDPPEHANKDKCIIGATATLIEKQSGLKFRARVDSGAKSCSLHVEKIDIQGASTKENITERMTENIGKVISFVVKNGDGKTHILKRKIAGYVIIKTSDKQEGKRRYKVPLTFLWKNMEKEVLVTLNNRQHMEFPLLIGRNFLRGDFLVDVELNSDD